VIEYRPMPQYAYDLIADTLRGRIADGTYPPGTRLPSWNALCTEFGVSRITVGRAMDILRREGLTEMLLGVGLYVKEPRP
jgi:GntR family transcriptional regulator